MENYMKKAADAFLVGRPYGMRVDFRRKGYVLFNRRMNVLGNEMQGDIRSRWKGLKWRRYR